MQFTNKQNKQEVIQFCYLKKTTSNFQVNAIYLDLLDNELWKVSLNI